MKTLEELDKEYAEKKADLIGQHNISREMPVPPYMVHFANKRNPWVCFKVNTLQEAVALAEKFPDKMAYVNAKGVYRHICPEELIAEQYKRDFGYRAVEIADGTPFMEASDSTYDPVSLVFFVRRGGQILKIRIAVARPPHQWVPRCIYHFNDNMRTRPIRKDYPTVPGATLVQWTTDNSASASYVWGCYEDFRAALTTLPEFQESNSAT